MVELTTGPSADSHAWSPGAHLVVPADKSDAAGRAAAFAHRLGDALDLEVHLLGWRGEFGPESAFARRARHLTPPTTADADVRATWSNEIDAADAIAGVDPDATVLMATHARGGVGQLLHGSVAAATLSRLDRPVVLVGPSADLGAVRWNGPVVVCLDGSSLAESAVPVAQAYASRMGVQVELVTVVDPAATDESHDVLESGYLERVVKGISGPVTWDTLHGSDTARSVAEYARSHASLVVATTHGRSGWSRVSAGSVATAIVHECPTPVVMCPQSDPGDVT